MIMMAQAVAICVFLLENHHAEPGLPGWQRQAAVAIQPLNHRHVTARFGHEAGVWAVEMSHTDPELLEGATTEDQLWRCEVGHRPGAVEAEAALGNLNRELMAGVDLGIWNDVTGRVDVATAAPAIGTPRVFAMCGTSGWMELVIFGPDLRSQGDARAVVVNTEDWSVCDDA